jgi:hypothetical protein
LPQRARITIVTFIVVFATSQRNCDIDTAVGLGITMTRDTRVISGTMRVVEATTQSHVVEAVPCHLITKLNLTIPLFTCPTTPSAAIISTLSPLAICKARALALVERHVCDNVNSAVRAVTIFYFALSQQNIMTDY